jgi:hypothetical protein
MSHPEARPHVFTAQEIDPSGIRVTVTITVPQNGLWKSLRDVSEFAQLTASRAMSQTLQSRQTSLEEPPF